MTEIRTVKIFPPRDFPGDRGPSSTGVVPHGEVARWSPATGRRFEIRTVKILPPFDFLGDRGPRSTGVVLHGEVARRPPATGPRFEIRTVKIFPPRYFPRGPWTEKHGRRTTR